MNCGEPRSWVLSLNPFNWFKSYVLSLFSDDLYSQGKRSQLNEILRSQIWLAAMSCCQLFQFWEDERPQCARRLGHLLNLNKYWVAEMLFLLLGLQNNITLCSVPVLSISGEPTPTTCFERNLFIFFDNFVVVVIDKYFYHLYKIDQTLSRFGQPTPTT